MHDFLVIQSSPFEIQLRSLLRNADFFRLRSFFWSRGCFALLLAQAFQLPGLLLADSLVISEIMVQQGVNVVFDEDQDAPDWIEIYNSSENRQELQGWSLSDELDRPRKWLFPDIELEPKAFLIIFASGKDCRDAGQVLHTNFRLSSEGEFLGLFSPDGALESGFHPEYPKLSEGVSFGFGHQAESALDESPSFKFFIPENGDLGQTWTDASFDDTVWDEGFGGIGFDGNSSRVLTPLIDTEIASKMRTKNSSIYIRYRIEIKEPNALMQLQIRYDDGFILYLNGKELVRRNAPTRATWNARSTSARIDGDELVPEQMTFTAKDGLKMGENILAIHGLNTRSTDRDFLFKMEPQLWFGLGAVGKTPGYTFHASPGAPNARVFSKTLNKPKIIADRGVSDEPIAVSLEHSILGVDLRYTMDGSIPTERSEQYLDSISIETSAQLNVRAFHQEMAPSPVETQLFLISDTGLLTFSSDVPVIVLDTEGGRISATSRTQALMQLFDRGDDGRARISAEPDFEGLASLKIRGSSTEGRPKKAYSMEIQDIYGNDRDVSLLDMPEDSDWILYAPYNFDRALMRNAFIYELSNQLGRYAVRTRFCEVYVNTRGQPIDQRSYAGVYVLMEKIKRGADRVPIDRLLRKHTEAPEVSGGYILKVDRLDPGDRGFSGGSQALAYVEPKEEEIERDQTKYLTDFLNDMNRTFRDRDYEKEVPDYDQYIDEAAWIDFHILNEFTKNPDGFRLSTYMHLPREGRLTFGPIWDFDRTMGPDDDGRAANPSGWSGVHRFGWWASIFRNPNFEQAYLDRWQHLRRGVMSVQNMHDIIDGMEAELEESQARNFQKWPLLRNTSAWRSEVRHLKNWIEDRAEWIDGQYVEPPDLITQPGVLPEGGLVQVLPGPGSIFYTTDGSDPRLPGGERSRSASSLSRARPEIFVEETTKLVMRSRLNDEWSGPIEALFVSQKIPNIKISEVMYHPVAPPLPTGLDEDDLEFVEFSNVGNSPLLMEGLNVSDAIEFTFGSHLIQPGESVVLASNPDALQGQFPQIDSAVFGPFDGRLSNGGERIVLRDGAGRLLDQIQFDDEDGWPVEADGDGSSLERIQFEESGPSAWQSSFAEGGSPGVLVLPSWKHVNILSVNDGIVRLEFEAQPGAQHVLFSSDHLGATEWETLFRWSPTNAPTVHRIDLDTTGSQRFFRIESN